MPKPKPRENIMTDLEKSNQPKTVICCRSCTNWTGLIEMDMKGGRKGHSLVERVCAVHGEATDSNHKCSHYELLTPGQRLTGQ